MPTDWQSIYEEEDSPQWDKGQPSPGLMEFLEKQQITGSTLVPGCGFGHDVRAISAQGAYTLGMDVAQGALDGASTFAKADGEKYVRADFLNLPEEYHGSFDWLFEHTLFCAIDPLDRESYVDAAHLALRPGGSLLAIFYMDPENEDDGPPFGTSKEELNALFNRKFRIVREWIPKDNYESRTGREMMRLYHKP